MNADVNIPSTDEGCGDDRGVAQSVLQSTTKRRSEVTVESIESVVKVVRISDDSSVEKKDEGTIDIVVDENKIAGATRADDQLTPSQKHTKMLKPSLESGSWKCKNSLCTAQDNDDMLVCKSCKVKYHYSCSDIPPYQIAQFVLVSSYRKYQCA